MYGLHFIKVIAAEPAYVPALDIIGAEVRADRLGEIRKELRKERMTARSRSLPSSDREGTLMRLFLLVTVAALLCSTPKKVSAHPLAPAVLTFEQQAEGTVSMRWRVPVKRPTGQSLRPQIPESCAQLGPPKLQKTDDETAIIETTELRCEAPDMLGAVVRVEGFEDSSVNVVVRIVRADGDVHHAILDTGTPALTIVAQQDESHSLFEYFMLGVGHLLTGWDHSTFVLGLLVLFGWHRRLIAAVTAFTVGHSLTLALSVLGIVSLPTLLVEALIALTIVVLALEVRSGEQGPVWRHPSALPGALVCSRPRLRVGPFDTAYQAKIPLAPWFQPRPRSRAAR